MTTDERAEEGLLEALRRLTGASTVNDVFESAPFGLLVDRPPEGCIYVNSAFAGMLGRTHRACLGFGWLQAVHPDDAPGLQKRLAESDGRPFDVEYRTLHSTGDTRWVRVHIHPLVDGDGLDLGRIALAEDITRERRFRERSTEAQKLEVVGRLSGRVAHDFNNLLTAVLGSAHLLGLRDDLDEEMQEALQTLEDVCEQGRYLTSQLLTLSRQRIDRKSSVDLDEALSSLARMLRRTLGEGMQVEFSLDGRGARVPLDAGQLGQIVLNLALNARDAAQGRGRVEICTRRHGERVVLSVIDDGPGMDPGTRARVFEPFFTTKAPGRGTGLGLATVKELVETLGGQVELHSEAGQGARFDLSFRALEAATDRDGLDVSTKTRLEGDGLVLLVEDLDTIRSTAGHALALVGYDVVAGGTLAGAEERLAEKAQLPDLIVTDVLLPDGTGLELVGRLRDQGFEGRVVYTSGMLGDAAVEAALTDPRASFVPKPYTVVQLLEAASTDPGA